MRVCPNCGEENPDRARFCMNCSTALITEAPSERRVRKTVTVLFCDMTGSTTLGEKLDPESLRRVMSRYYDALRDVIERHGGTVEKFIGDAVMGVFGIPVLHEDDALRAVRAAGEIPIALAMLNSALVQEFGAGVEVRVGVNTGEVVAGDPSQGQNLITGDAVNVAARLEQSAPPGEIYIGSDTYRLVRNAVEVEELTGLTVKGKTDPLRAFKLIAVTAGVPGQARRMDSPMVGRERQRQLLRQVFDATRQDRACHLFTLLGPAGVGKSRLITELFREVEAEATILQGRCLPYGEGITFWPIVEILRDAAGVVESDSPDVGANKIKEFLESGHPDLLPAGLADNPEVLRPLCDVAGIIDSPTTNEQRFWAIRKFLEDLGKHRPLIVAFDDIHWAEPALLDLLEHIADWSRGSSILLLCMARPDLLDMRVGWGGGKFNATTILLEPLNETESQTLVANLLSQGELPSTVLDQILDAAEGNPLFLEEMLAMLIDDGLLTRTNGQWTSGDLSRLSVPPSIHALIAARLDRLQQEERVVIERAAVIGKEFDLGAVANLMPDEAESAVAMRLMGLVRKDLIRPSDSDPTGNGFAFRHLLIQDAAYGGVPKETRAELHHRFADWVESEAGQGGLREYEEIVGHHLEQASKYLNELGIHGERVGELQRRAAERLGSAGVRSYARADATAAENLLGRAVELLPPEDENRIELLPFLGAAKGDLSDLGGAETAYQEAVELGGRVGRDDIRWHGKVAIEHLRLATDPGADLDQILATAEAAIAGLEATPGSDLAKTLAWFLVVLVNHRLGRRAADAASKALAHARAARQPRQEADACGLMMVSAIFGSMPLAEALRLGDELAESSQGNRLMDTWLFGSRGAVRVLLGMVEEGRAMLSESRARVEEFGLEFGIAAMSSWHADLELVAGDYALAEELFRKARSIMEKIGDESAVAALAGALARTYYRQGKLEDAERYAAESRGRLPATSLHLRTRWRDPTALLLARRGDFDQAQSLARQWQEYIDTTDTLLHRADAWMDIAEIHQIEGDVESARVALARAQELYAQKGEVHGRAQAEQLLEELAG